MELCVLRMLWLANQYQTMSQARWLRQADRIQHERDGVKGLCIAPLRPPGVAMLTGAMCVLPAPAVLVHLWAEGTVQALSGSLALCVR